MLEKAKISTLHSQRVVQEHETYVITEPKIQVLIREDFRHRALYCLVFYTDIVVKIILDRVYVDASVTQRAVSVRYQRSAATMLALRPLPPAAAHPMTLF